MDVHTYTSGMLCLHCNGRAPMLPSPVFFGQRRRQGMGKVTWALIMPCHARASAPKHNGLYTRRKRRSVHRCTAQAPQHIDLHYYPVKSSLDLQIMGCYVCVSIWLVLPRSGCHCCPFLGASPARDKRKAPSYICSCLSLLCLPRFYPRLRRCLFWSA
jgi:hypothetical protein